MVLIQFTKRCSQSSCARLASWGNLTDGSGTVCAAHKSVIVDSPVVNFRAMCKVAGCRDFATWGSSASQPSHCSNHGPRVDGLVLTVLAKDTKSTPSLQHNSVTPSLPFNVKTEGYF